jgi:hypothetical protein
MKNTQNTDYVAVIPFYKDLNYFNKSYLFYNNSQKHENQVRKNRINVILHQTIHKHSPVWLIISTDEFKNSKCIISDGNVYDNIDEFKIYNTICKSGLLKALKANKANPKLIRHVENNQNIHIKTLVKYEEGR